MFTFKKAPLGILPLTQDIEDKDGASEQSTMLDHDDYLERKPQSRAWRVWSSNVPWIITTIMLSLYILLVIPSSKSEVQVVERVVEAHCEIQQPTPQQSQHEIQQPTPWSVTDVEYIRPMLEESIKTFTTGLDYQNENHTLQHTPSEGLKYVGPPGRDIDAAWEEIAGTQETFITREEAIASMVEDTYVSPLTGLLVVEIESFHHLHCLNYIRKSLDLDSYPDIKNQQTWRIHVEHCINSIREFIMCKADMTPIKLVPPEKSFVPVPVPEFRTKHVCRNFNEVAKVIQTERSANLGEGESLELARRIREKTGTRY